MVRGRDRLTRRARFWLFCLFGVWIAATAASALDDGQTDKASTTEIGDRKVFFSFSASPFYQPKTAMDGGGEFSLATLFLRFDVIRPIGDKLILALRLRYDVNDYEFDGQSTLGSPQPWHDVRGAGFSVPITSRIGKRWMLIAAPSLDNFHESGADLSDAWSYGAAVTGLYTVKPERSIGVGLGIFQLIEQLRGFPFLAIRWKFTERLRLSNPFQTGPTGPAGLELVYRFGNHWEIAGGAAYRTLRFRLDDQGIAPGGVGENTGVPSFVRLTWQAEPVLKFDLYGGAILAGELRVEDGNGRLVASDQYPVAAFAALTGAIRF